MMAGATCKRALKCLAMSAVCHLPGLFVAIVGLTLMVGFGGPWLIVVAIANGQDFVAGLPAIAVWFGLSMALTTWLFWRGHKRTGVTVASGMTLLWLAAVLATYQVPWV